jgi:hypothetical protein
MRVVFPAGWPGYPMPFRPALRRLPGWEDAIRPRSAGMEKIATEVLVERLADWGVDTVFGLLKRSARPPTSYRIALWLPSFW